MPKIELTKGYYATVEDADHIWLMRWSWHAQVKTVRVPYVLAMRTEKKVAVAMHNAIWERHNGPIPEGYTVDHIDHGVYGALDNRLSNLRLATASQQSRNQRKTIKKTTSPYKGVSFKDSGEKKWVSQICHNNKRHYLGKYSTPEEAAIVYDIRALKLSGNHCILNFPDKIEEYMVECSKLSLDEAIRPFREEKTVAYNGVFARNDNGNTKYRAVIAIGGKKVSLGTYDDPYDAALAYDMARVHVGVHLSKLNFPERLEEYREALIVQ